MLSFESDYIMGAHPKIFEKMMQTNYQSQPGYGADAFSRRAARKIRKACGSPKAQVFFLAGGTQTNQIVISALTRSYEEQKQGLFWERRLSFREATRQSIWRP